MGKILTITVAVCAIGSLAWADWTPGDPSKMHYPQLPDADGWDVKGSGLVSLADDFQCTETGPITDIHWWGSWQGNDVQHGQIQWTLGIYSDDTSGTFSQPGTLLWQTIVQNPTIVEQPQSTQSWFDPSTGQGIASDHTRWFQYNVVNIPNPFIQQAGQIYWLRISGTGQGTWGWKTSVSPQFRDAAVWSAPLQLQPYTPLFIGQSPEDLAFVITPEPVSLTLLAVGGLVLLRRRH